MGGDPEAYTIIGWPLYRDEFIKWIRKNNLYDKEFGLETELNSFRDNYYYSVEHELVNLKLKEMGLIGGNYKSIYFADGDTESYTNFYIVLNYIDNTSFKEIENMFNQTEKIKNCQEVISQIYEKEYKKEPKLFTLLQNNF